MDTPTSDQGMTDTTLQDAVETETGSDTGPADPGADLIEPEWIAPEVPTQDLSPDETRIFDVVKPDPAISDSYAQEPGPDSTPAKFIVRVFAEGQEPGSPDPLPGAEVTILDNGTGESMGMSGQTDAKGEVAFDLNPGLVFGVRVRKQDFVDLYRLDVKEEWGSLGVGMISRTMVEAVSQSLGIQWDTTKGLIAGRVVFGTGPVQEDVGCAVVQSDPAGEVRYWDPESGMPGTPDKAPTTSKKNASFVVINVQPGPVHLTVTIEDTVVTARDTISFAGGITDLQVTVPGNTNPTPADCTL